ncbi:unnamed protein product [Urochloa humidicola]
MEAQLSSSLHPSKPPLVMCHRIRKQYTSDLCKVWNRPHATPLIAGLAVAATALAGRYGIQAWQAYKARPIVPRMRKFYDDGFQPTMNRWEAALILGARVIK